jgi:hypothetical protein
MSSFDELPAPQQVISTGKATLYAEANLLDAFRKKLIENVCRIVEDDYSAVIFAEWGCVEGSINNPYSRRLGRYLSSQSLFSSVEELFRTKGYFVYLVEDCISLRHLGPSHVVFRVYTREPAFSFLVKHTIKLTPSHIHVPHGF